MLGIDSIGIDFEVHAPSGTHTDRVEFPTPIKDSLLVTAELFALVVAARAASGEDGQTSAERVLAELGGIRTFVTSVVAVADVQPHLRRITFGGGDLTSFQPLGPDTFLYLLPSASRPHRADRRPAVQLGVGERHARGGTPGGGYYTVRAWRSSVAEMDVLMVLHGDSGHASSWAARAQVGDPVALWGPRTSWNPPAATDRYLLVAGRDRPARDGGDHRVAARGHPNPGRGRIAVGRRRQELPERDGVQVVWCDRNGAEPGTTSLLEDAVRALPWSDDGSLYVWGGGESHAMTAVRRYVRRERGLDRDAVDLVPYWRHSSTTDSDLDDDE